jgi:hypothetical protein
MNDAGVGRLLVASLHQGIADVLPSRLEFYEGWLHPEGLRDGRISLPSLKAVLSFLRQEGEPYSEVAARAGEYTAEWIVHAMPSWRRRFANSLPPRVRMWYVMRLARRLVRQTYGGSRAVVRWRGLGAAGVDLRGSLFCEVREPVSRPLCQYYSAAIVRLMTLFALDVHATTNGCRGAGAPRCLIALALQEDGSPE